MLTGFANLEVVKSDTLPALELLNGPTVREIYVIICPPADSYNLHSDSKVGDFPSKDDQDQTHWVNDPIPLDNISMKMNDLPNLLSKELYKW